MTLLGLLWAMAAPLLLLLPWLLVVRVLSAVALPQRLGVGPDRERRVRWATAAALVLAVVLALWLPPRLRFARLCDELGPPRIDAVVQADGFFLDDSTANSFGMRYLHDEGFAWIEARSIYRRDAYTRYTWTPGGIQTQEVEALTARYSVVALHEPSADGDVSVHRLQVLERDSGRVLASAANANFLGGPAKWVLGAYGSAHCPNPISAAGGEAFQRNYHLARDTLRPAPRR